MNKREWILVAALLLTISAAVYAGVLALQRERAIASLEEDMRAQVAQSDRLIQQLDLNAKRLSKQLSDTRDDLAFVKRCGTEREKEVSALNEKLSALAKENVHNMERLEDEHRNAQFPHYNTAAQLLALPACTLTDTKNNICAVSFKDVEGRSFWLGGPGASREVARFINSLEDGKSYSMPAAFVAFQKKNSLKTAAQILALKPRSYSLEEGNKYDAMLEGDNGDTIHLGGENAEPVVLEFLKTLKEGKSYTLPTAFADYQKTPAPSAQKPAEKAEQF